MRNVFRSLTKTMLVSEDRRTHSSVGSIRVGLTLLALLLLVACGSQVPPTNQDSETYTVMVRPADAPTSQDVSSRGSELGGATIDGVIEIYVVEQGWVRQVRYRLDDMAKSVTVTEAPFPFHIDTAELSVGEHVLSVEPFMPNGIVRNAVRVNFQVNSTVPGTEDNPEPEPEPEPTNPNDLLWIADMETGDISQWSQDNEELNMNCGGPQNSGGGTANASTKTAKRGNHSAALTIQDVNGDQGTRLFRGRCESANHPQGLYYGIWFYIPTHFETLDGWWNIFQFKSKPHDYNGGSDPMWVIDLLDQGNGTMRLRLRDKITGNSTYHGTANQNFPTGQWVHLEAFLKGGHNNDGQITIWQDGTEIFTLKNINTIRENGDIRWAVNNYTSAIRPDPATIYIDDATISTTKIGPNTQLP